MDYRKILTLYDGVNYITYNFRPEGGSMVLDGENHLHFQEFTVDMVDSLTLIAGFQHEMLGLQIDHLRSCIEAYECAGIGNVVTKDTYNHSDLGYGFSAKPSEKER